MATMRCTLKFGATDYVKESKIRVKQDQSTPVAIRASVDVAGRETPTTEWAAVIHVFRGNELLLALPVAGASHTASSVAVIEMPNPADTTLNITASTTMVHVSHGGEITVTVDVVPPGDALTTIKCPEFCQPPSVTPPPKDTYAELEVAINATCHRLLRSQYGDSLTERAIKSIAYGRHRALMKTHAEYKLYAVQQRITLVMAHSAPWFTRWVVAWKTIREEILGWLAINRCEQLPRDVSNKLVERAILLHLREGKEASEAQIDMMRATRSALVMASQYMSWWMNCDVLAAAARAFRVEVSVVPLLPPRRPHDTPKWCAVHVSETGRPYWEDLVKGALSAPKMFDVFTQSAAGAVISPREMTTSAPQRNRKYGMSFAETA